MTELKKLGWEFMQTGPEEWQWMKFNPESGAVIAVQGDETWKKDREWADLS